MKRLLFAWALLYSLEGISQGTLNDYQKAASCMKYKMDKLVYRAYVNPAPVDSIPAFTYLVHTRNGKEFFIIDIKKRTRHGIPQEKLAEQLSKKTGKAFKTYSLPFNTIKPDQTLRSFTFKADTTTWQYNIEANELTQVKSDPEYKDTELLSPDKKKLLIWENHNLKLRDLGSGKITTLTTDGKEQHGYGSAFNWYSYSDETNHEPYDYDLEAYWTPDSKKLVIPKFDRTQTRHMKMLKWAPGQGLRPHLMSYERAMPGDTDLTTATYVIIDTENNKIIPIDLQPVPEFLGTYIYFTEDNKKAYRIEYKRGYTARTLIEIDLATGKTKKLMDEIANTSVDVRIEYFEPFFKNNEYLWWSEQDGWSHIYLYDLRTGKMKNQVTKGEYVVRNIEQVDAEKRKVYFMASGKESGRDPYLKHLYVVNFDGSGLKLLTPENAEHQVTFIKGADCFVDNYSNIDEPNVAVLRSLKDGKVLMELEKADIKDLQALGWKAPESFTVKARDGKTDIYGVIYRPFNFDPTKKYPVIDATYSGPHTIRSPKMFRKALLNDDVPLAQLGFIVVTIDGLGSAFRSKAFHDHSWKNLGDIGAPDHIKAIRELAKKYTYMDTSRVGIYGHSAGGYDAARALLTHSEFYKVAVSSAGCHDLRIDKVWWPEHHMGVLGKHYEEQSNFTDAAKLTGKLLLVHGDVDNNVNPVATLRLVAELIKNNKDFDLLIIPGQDHYTMYDDKYFIRKRWDYFVKNLMRVEPPAEYKLE